jgi:hypothetical protein
MLVARLQRKVTLPQRVMAVFMARQGQRLHYTILARRLHHPIPRKVVETCVRLAAQGRLQWYGPGIYGLPQHHEEDNDAS